jgi:ParB/RepB/Spo0J family partition protein
MSEIEEGDRARKDYHNVNELASSIKSEGLIQPIAVKELAFAEEDEKKYLLLAGGRRFRAIQLLKWETVPVTIYAEEISPLDCKSIELAENLIRKDLTFVEEVKLKAEIHQLQVEIHGEKLSTSPDAPGWSMTMTAEMLNENQSNVSRDITLARAIDQFPELAEQKNKSDAMKMLRKKKQMEVNAELSKKIDEKVASTPMETIKKLIFNGYILGNFLTESEKIADNSMDMIEVDPPYGIDLQGQKRNFDSIYPTDSYNEVLASAYPDFITNVMLNCYRIMRADGWIVVWFGPDPWFSLILRVMKDIGFKFMGIPAIWSKGTGQTSTPNRYLARSHEMFFYATKESGIIVNQGRADVFEFRPVHGSHKIHPTERPVELMQDILRTFTKPSAKVLVPFAGSGATLLAAANLRMVATGYDLSSEYKEAFAMKVMQNDPPNYSSYKKGQEE